VGPVALAVMAKAPAPGAVKTRLCPPLTAPQAAALARCFLQDRVEQVGRVAGARPLVAFAPPDAEAAVAALLPPGVRLVPQAGADLGARMDRLLSGLLAEGHAGAVALGTDTPTLPTAFVEAACAALRARAADLVLGPAEDGGYYLVGVAAPAPALFAAMPWGTSAVLAETLARAGRLGLRLHLLPPWFDVDRGEDLARLRAERRGPGPAHRPPRTLAFLDALAGGRDPPGG
jgi:rSAM/selenodomain-associated transferase 1